MQYLGQLCFQPSTLIEPVRLNHIRRGVATCRKSIPNSALIRSLPSTLRGAGFLWFHWQLLSIIFPSIHPNEISLSTTDFPVHHNLPPIFAVRENCELWDSYGLAQWLRGGVITSPIVPLTTLLAGVDPIVAEWLGSSTGTGHC